MLHRPLVDAGVEPDQIGQIQQAFLLAGHRGAAAAGGHEQRLDAERVTGAEQFAGHGVPQREGEHAAQPLQHVGAPVVVAGDDGLAVAVGGEDGTVPGAQFVAQLEVVVDLAVEHQHVAVGGLRRSPPQRLMRMRDVDDGQPVEPEHHFTVRVGVEPGAWLVRPAVAHQVRRSGDGAIGPLGPTGSAGRVSHERQQSTHGAPVCQLVGPCLGTHRRPAERRGLRCVVFESELVVPRHRPSL